MKVEVENLNQVSRKVEVILPEETVNNLEESIYAELKGQAKIKGFRPGKVPRSIIENLYKDFIDSELKRKIVETTMAEALTIANVNPVVEPYVDFIEKEGQRGYTLECEVIPEIELPQYSGIEVEVEAINVTDEEIEKRIEGMQEMHAELIAKEGNVDAKNGDFVLIKYQGYADGKPLKDVTTDSYPLELGKNTIMPEFEDALIGMKAGEEKDIEITFPEDYPDKEFAKKKVLFKVTLKEIKEKRLPEINNEFAKDLGFEDMVALKVGLKKEIEKEKETAKKKNIAHKIMETLTNGVAIPVPTRLLGKRVEAMIEDAKLRFKTETMSQEEMSKFESNLKKEFEKRAEEMIKEEVVLAKIAEKETIKTEENDIHERIKRIAEDAKKPYEEVKNFYEQYNLMGGLKKSIMQEKTIDFLRDKALIKEKA